MLVDAPVWDPRTARQILKADTNYDHEGNPLPRTLEYLKADGQFADPRLEWVDTYNALRTKAGKWARKTMEALTWYDLLSRLHHIRATATLVVYGELDQLRKDEDILLYNIPNASKVVLPRQGHIPQIDNPEAFVLAVLPFLK